jgi:hypothetical protein
MESRSRLQSIDRLDATNTRQDGVRDFKSKLKYVRNMASARWYMNLVSLHPQHFSVAQVCIYAHAFIKGKHPEILATKASCLIPRHTAHKSVSISQRIQPVCLWVRGSFHDLNPEENRWQNLKSPLTF